MSEVIKKVNNRLFTVFGLIEDAEGGAHLVETKRGKSYRAIDAENNGQEVAFNRRGIGLNRPLAILAEDPHFQLEVLREVFV